jgi:serine/threonine protein kinase
VLSPGTVLDHRYEIIDAVASGGMGHVYRARRTWLGDEIALKVINAQGADAESLRERFMLESRVCAQLRHPHIVTVLDFNVDAAGQPFLVMELLNGPSLREELERLGPLPLARVREIVLQVGSALQLAHDRGILHRDLKPANIVSHRFDSGQIVYKVVDFGLANLRAETDATRLTQAGMFLGTVAYASPEQLRGDPLDARTDVYALGAVVFELLTGRPPFAGDSTLSVITRKLTTDAPRASSLRPDLPGDIDDALRRALARDPADRCPSIAALGRAFADTTTAGAGEGISRTAAAVVPPDLARTDLTVKYDIGPQIAAGRLGSAVHSGVHRALGHPVAIRILRRTDPQTWDPLRARFLREAQTLQVAHPALVHVRDYGEERDLVYVVTDLVEGESLRERIAREPRGLAWTSAAPLVRDIAEAAAVLHRRGGLLCGLTPEIIRVTTDEDRERLVISTGGICQLQDLLATLSERTLRGVGLVDRELYYLAPEVLTGQRPDERSDIYAIGAVAYEMVTGSVPYEANTLPELIGLALRGALRDPRELGADIPPAAAQLVARALAADRDVRFGSAADLRRALLAAGA